jgi:O-antigen/teichoic acid export membrane protein
MNARTKIHAPTTTAAIVTRRLRPPANPGAAWLRTLTILRTPLLARIGAVGLATLLSKLLTLAALGIAARALGPQNWGLVGSALAAVAYASVLLSPGLLAWGTREIARDRQATPATLLIVNLTQTLLACGAYLGVAAFAARWLDDPAARAILLVSATALFAQAFSVEWVFDGLERTHVQACLQLILSAARLAAVIWLCRSAADVLAYAAILPFFLGVQALAGSLLLYRGGWFRLAWPAAAQARRALRAAWPLGLTMALFVLAHNANTLLVETHGGPLQAGHYLAALRFVEMASVLPGVVGAVFRPRLARVFAAGSPAAARETRLYARAHLLAGLLLAPLVFAEAPRIIGWLYGAQYAPAAPLLRIFTLAILANYLVCGYTNCLVAFGRDRVMLGAMAAAAASAIGAGLLLTPRWGPPGAALAASLIHPVGWLAALPEYRRTIGPLDWSGWKRPAAAAAAIVALSGWLETQGVGTLYRIAASLIVYLAIAAPCWSELEQSIRRQGLDSCDSMDPDSMDPRNRKNPCDRTAPRDRAAGGSLRAEAPRTQPTGASTGPRPTGFPRPSAACAANGPQAHSTQAASRLGPQASACGSVASFAAKIPQRADLAAAAPLARQPAK